MEAVLVINPRAREFFLLPSQADCTISELFFPLKNEVMISFGSYFEIMSWVSHPIFFYIFNCLFCLKYLCNLFFCVCVTSNVTRICAFLILYYMKKTHGLLLSNVSLLDTVQWTRNMCSCLYICSSSWASRNKKSNHCVCRKHLPRGNFIPVWKDSLLLFRLLHCSVACSKGKISQVSLSWSNSVTREDRLHLK